MILNSTFSIHYEPEMDSSKEQIFKSCPMCEKRWESRDAFLGDPDLIFNGYQANFGMIEDGLFYFTHETTDCGSTMVIKAHSFLSLYSGSRYTEAKHLSSECSRYCLDRNQLARCQAQCEYAFVREVSQIIKNMTESSARTPVPSKA